MQFMPNEEDINQLIKMITSINDDIAINSSREPYSHMGATITDSILQAGLSYKNVVYPRVLKLITEYNSFKTTCDFLILMQTIPLEKLINWKNKEKLSRIEKLSWFFFENEVNNEKELSIWLKSEDNISTLREIKGIGPKTIDYLQILSGNESIAIDRHLKNFLRISGINTNSYEEAKYVLSITADSLGISKYEIDKRIWLFMSKPKKKYPDLTPELFGGIYD